MSQSPIVVSTTPPLPGLQLVTEVNDALETIATDFAGATDPASEAFSYSLWADTATGYVKRRNAANSAWDIVARIVPTVLENDTGDLVVEDGDVILDGVGSKIKFKDGSEQTSAATNYMTWQAIQTSNFAPTTKNAYPVNTTSAAITATLPASPAAGDYMEFVDYAGTFQTNAFTINPNGKKINGSTSSIVVNTPRASITLVYIDATQGWVAFGGFQSSPIGSYSINYLLIGGGAGGGNSGAGGGGAGGGFKSGSTIVQPGTSLSVIVGSGGVGGASPTNGGTSSLGTIDFALGGGNGSVYTGAATSPGGNGGSGGGAAPNGTTGATGVAGSGTSGQGNAGGVGYSNTTTISTGGGGGGAGSAGGNATSVAAGSGGAGTSSSISGTATNYAGGGAGGQIGASGASGGVGGGGATGVAGTTNTGGGGGAGANGGSGIAFIAYAGAQRGTGGTVTSAGGYTIHTFISSGTYTS